MTARPLLLSPLRLLVALLALVVGVASSAGVAEAQNGVAAINPESAAAVEAAGDIGPGHVGSEGLLFDDGTSGCCVAPSSSPTFRGDSRPPSQIFDEGFQPVGSDLDLLRHAEGYPGSGYVSTSKSPTVAQDFGPNVYEVRAPGGVDVNATLGPRSPFPSELEVAYPGGVPSSCIVGCTLPDGRWVPNPGFGPR